MACKCGRWSWRWRWRWRWRWHWRSPPHLAPPHPTLPPSYQGDVEKKHMVKCIRRIMNESGLVPPSAGEMATLAFGDPDADDDEGDDEGEGGSGATGILALYAKVKAGLCTGFGRSFVVKMDELPLTVGQLTPNTDYRVEVAVANAFGSSPFGSASESELAACQNPPSAHPSRPKRTSPKAVREVQSPEVNEGERGGPDDDPPNGEESTALVLSPAKREASSGAEGEMVTFESPNDGAGGHGGKRENPFSPDPMNRSLSRTFSMSGEVIEAEVRALFDLLDRNKDGDVTKAEVILTIREAGKTNDVALLQQLEDTLGLPDAIKQEHGRDQFEKVFQELDGTQKAYCILIF